MYCPRLNIQTNHGYVLMGNVTVADGVARGELLGGQETARLFTASSTKQLQPRPDFSYPVYGRKPYPAPGIYSPQGRSPQPGTFEVDCVFCG
jgi:hypothetical protein